MRLGGAQRSGGPQRGAAVKLPPRIYIYTRRNSYTYPIITMREHCHVRMAFALLSSLRRLGLLLGGLLGLASFPLANGQGGSLGENPLDGESVVIRFLLGRILDTS